MNSTTSTKEAKLAKEKDHRASNTPYRVAILAAIESLHDFQTRSSVDSIRKYVKSSLPPDVEWNNTLFLTSLKAAVQDGDLERNTFFCNFSPSKKVKRTEEIKTLLEKKSHPSLPNLDPEFAEKDERKGQPAKKTVHAKPKIISKKVMDRSRIENPMETI